MLALVVSSCVPARKVARNSSSTDSTVLHNSSTTEDYLKQGLLETLNFDYTIPSLHFLGTLAKGDSLKSAGNQKNTSAIRLKGSYQRERTAEKGSRKEEKKEEIIVQAQTKETTKEVPKLYYAYAGFAVAAFFFFFFGFLYLLIKPYFKQKQS